MDNSELDRSTLDARERLRDRHARHRRFTSQASLAFYALVSGSVLGYYWAHDEVDLVVDFIVVVSLAYAGVIRLGSHRPLSAGVLLLTTTACALPLGVLIVDYAESDWEQVLDFAWLLAAPFLIAVGFVGVGLVGVYQTRAYEHAYWKAEIETRPPLPFCSTGGASLSSDARQADA